MVDSEKIGKVAKTGARVVGWVQLIGTIIFVVILSIIMIFLMLIGIPWYIGVGGIIFALLILIFRIIWLKRVSSVRLN